MDAKQKAGTVITWTLGVIGTVSVAFVTLSLCNPLAAGVAAGLYALTYAYLVRE